MNNLSVEVVVFDHHVDEASFNAVKNALGEEAVLELTAVAGYYTLISMVLRAFEVQPPEDAKPLS